MNGVHNLIELTYRTIKIEEGTPGYAAVNSDTNIMYISYPFSNSKYASGVMKLKYSSGSP